MTVEDPTVDGAGGAGGLAGMRVDYREAGLVEADLAATWHEQLSAWLDAARSGGVVEANAMVLATTGPEGRPSSRTVLCKGLDERGVVFYTNYTSTKSHDLLATRWACATFPWYALHRQVHVRGPVEKVSPEETAAYWSGRPRGSQLGAWASAQSVAVRDRGVLDDALVATERRFTGHPVPVPPHWGGWRIRPDEVEFWQGRTDRMHDRLRFRADERREWTVQRLAP